MTSQSKSFKFWSMRSRANTSLIVLAMAFFIIVVVRATYGETMVLNGLLFVVEAGLVGALADWFAVTALFRHPLGLKFIPHTAIIPRNKVKLIEGVVKLVEEQLLNRELIAQKISQINVTRSVIDAIGAQPFERIDTRKIEQLIIKLLRSIATEANGKELERIAEGLILKSSPNKLLASLLSVAHKNKWDNILITKLLNMLHSKLSSKQTLDQIKNMLEQETKQHSEEDFFSRLLFQAAKAINAVNTDDAAEIIYYDLLKQVEQLKDETHELRLWLSEELLKLAEQLKENDNLNAVLKAWLIEALQLIKLEQSLPSWISVLLGSDSNQTSSKFVEQLAWLLKKAANRAWRWFINTKSAQDKVEDYIKSFIVYLLQYEYKVIGDIVMTTLSNFSDEQLSVFIESKVEVDLQRIRLNGALIGAVLGAILYTFLHFVYTPILHLF